MAFSKLLVASLLASLLLLHLVDATDQSAYAQTQGSLLQRIDCKGACRARCRLSSRQKMCHRACGTCCSRCNCVPPGTAGNEDVCPCYATLTTHGGRHKCP
ncbi:gibberellin-regulated protein 1-like precursor [Cicer arietinum]|uniref:Gibberellin-regulated protein 1-like precursor n=1 Tax=Cicer arietinum TaxID=3827 RepID=A0A3Q7K715_CICAR|nr:gibberellin-regulated protein 1-like precursor [Cicer arietinum]